AKASARAAKEAAAAASGARLRGRRPGPDRQLQKTAASLQAVRAEADAARPVAAQANLTDPDSRIMKTPSGWVQGYNAQAAANPNQIVIACAVTQDANDSLQYQPMVAAAQEMLQMAGISEAIGIVL